MTILARDKQINDTITNLKALAYEAKLLGQSVSNLNRVNKNLILALKKAAERARGHE